MSSSVPLFALSTLSKHSVILVGEGERRRREKKSSEASLYLALYFAKFSRNSLFRFLSLSAASKCLVFPNLSRIPEDEHAGADGSDRGKGQAGNKTSRTTKANSARGEERARASS